MWTVFRMAAMFDGYPVPDCPDCMPPGPIECFLSLWLVFWMWFFLIVYILPPKWSDAVWEIAFPFIPRKNPNS